MLLANVQRLSGARPDEIRAVLWAFAYFFCLLASYYLLRPVRDEMGVAGGVGNLQWLFTATFLAMLLAVPAFGALVARLPRQRFIPLVYHFLAFNLAIFWILLLLGVERLWVARVFFVWISIFSLFAVSVFWSFVADLFTSEQAKRLFGFIAAGGSAGAMVGSSSAIWLAQPLGPSNLIMVAALLLEAAVFCATRLERHSTALEHSAGAERPIPDDALGGGWLAGIMMIMRSPYLAGIALWVCALSLAGTFLYFAQANIVAAASADPAIRTRLFGQIDLAVNVITIVTQLVVTGRIITRFGIGRAAALTPLVFLIGFVVLALAPVFWVVVAFQALQRGANFAISNPARESLFTVIDREAKYKAKNVIDIVVFRGADAVWAWLFAALRGLQFSLGTIALAAVPVMAAWFALSLALGRAQRRRAASATAVVVDDNKPQENPAGRK
jgi:AAA family ATP:ADP antiporter